MKTFSQIEKKIFSKNNGPNNYAKMEALSDCLTSVELASALNKLSQDKKEELEKIASECLNKIIEITKVSIKNES